jgi:hypothetical protein
MILSKVATVSLKSINQFIFVIEKRCICCAVGTESSNMI